MGINLKTIKSFIKMFGKNSILETRSASHSINFNNLKLVQKTQNTRKVKPIELVKKNGDKVSFEYNSNGTIKKSTITDSNTGHITLRTYDNSGRIKLLDRHDSFTTFKRHKSNNKISEMETRFTGKRGSEIKSFVYDGHGKFQNYKIKDADVNLKIFDKKGNLETYLSSQDILAMRAYQGASKEFTANLRASNKLEDFYQNTVRKLDNMCASDNIAKTAGSDITFYRGIGQIDKKHFDIMTTKGSTFIDKSYVSTSNAYDVAEKFAKTGNSNLMLEIKLPKGTKYLDINHISPNGKHFAGENEMLLPRNQKFLVKDFDAEKKVAKLELVS